MPKRERLGLRFHRWAAQGCEHMPKQERPWFRFAWWEGGARGGGPGAPSNLQYTAHEAPPRTVGIARNGPGGLQEASEESRKLLVCSKKLPGRLASEISMCFTRSGGLPEAPGARILCILRGPAASQRLQGRESYVFYEVRRPPLNRDSWGTLWLRLRVKGSFSRG